MKLSRMIRENEKLKEESDGIPQSSISRDELYNVVNDMLNKGMAPDDVAKEVVDKYETDIEEISIVMEDDGYELEDFRFDDDTIESEEE